MLVRQSAQRLAPASRLGLGLAARAPAKRFLSSTPLLRNAEKPSAYRESVSICPGRELLRSFECLSRYMRACFEYKDGLTSGQMSKYKTFMGPFGKVFLGAILTYQIIYWSWLKLEMDESKLEKNEEMAGLEKKARELAAAQK
ncbi:hypothetical protein N7481_008955 [Penicillium waksmanii]|uniref:uncharacterized protein n=1 Tax=Penicillium waksmanii TaxID=69791 RepID=UPI002548CE65|nr:uncharacterized protein N7481_008955 [Penicillium waksmanii]KAJ5975248.1 hypothetical protein N7481_008955 [Penicillium waksmanii]